MSSWSRSIDPSTESSGSVAHDGHKLARQRLRRPPLCPSFRLSSCLVYNYWLSPTDAVRYPQQRDSDRRRELPRRQIIFPITGRSPVRRSGRCKSWMSFLFYVRKSNLRDPPTQIREVVVSHIGDSYHSTRLILEDLSDFFSRGEGTKNWNYTMTTTSIFVSRTANSETRACADASQRCWIIQLYSLGSDNSMRTGDLVVGRAPSNLSEANGNHF